MRLPKIKKLPSGNYNAQLQIDGRRISLTSDSRKELEHRILYLKLENRLRPQNTLSQAIRRYIDDKSNVLSVSTIRGYNAILNNRFQEIMETPLPEIKNWQKIVNNEAKLVSAKTLKNSWGLVSSVLKENDIEVNVHLPMVISRKRNFLQPEQIKPFIATIYGDRYELVYLLCLHSLRRSEMLALEKQDVTDVIRINKARVTAPDHKMVTKPTTKNVSSTRTVPVFIPRINELVNYLPEGTLIHCDPHWVNTHLKKICEWNSLPVVTLHGLRHSFASLCYHLNISELQCMEFGGWSDLTTMRKIYTHIADTDRQKATDALRSFLQ